MTARSPHAASALAWCLAAALGTGVPCAGAQGLYKVIGADGTVTYTDRPSTAANVRVVPVGRPGSATPDNEPALPLVLREASTRFPVVLFTIPDCPACDRGRDLLKARGIPYRERRADADTDRDTWVGIVGTPDAPVLTVGTGQLRGFTSDQWHDTLDLAGYPRESKLPPTHPPALVAPLVEPRREVPRAVAAPAPAPMALPISPPQGGIRF